MALDFELLSLGKTDLDLAIALYHGLETVLDLLFGSCKLIEDGEGLISIGFISIPLLGKLVKLVSQFHEQRWELVILQMSELYLSNVWKHGSCLRIHTFLLNGSQLLFISDAADIVLNYGGLSLGANTLNITYYLQMVENKLFSFLQEFLSFDLLNIVGISNASQRVGFLIPVWQGQLRI